MLACQWIDSLIARYLVSCLRHIMFRQHANLVEVIPNTDSAGVYALCEDDNAVSRRWACYHIVLWYYNLNWNMRISQAKFLEKIRLNGRYFTSDNYESFLQCIWIWIEIQLRSLSNKPCNKKLTFLRYWYFDWSVSELTQSLNLNLNQVCPIVYWTLWNDNSHAKKVSHKSS